MSEATDSKALREALDLCVGRLRAIARDIESGENLRDGIGVICQWANSAEQALAAAPASPAGSGASEPPIAPALSKEALDRLLDDMGIDERLENFFLRHAPILWDDSWRCTCSQWMLSRERNTVEQANKSRAEHLAEAFRVEFDALAVQPIAGPSELALTEGQLRVIIYDALKDQFPAEGAAMMVADCCAGSIKRELDRAIAEAKPQPETQGKP